MSNIAFLFLPLAFSSLPAVLPFLSPSSQVDHGGLGAPSWAHPNAASIERCPGGQRRPSSALLVGELGSAPGAPGSASDGSKQEVGADELGRGRSIDSIDFK